MDFAITMTTTDSESTARALAESVVNRRLGACVQIVGPLTAVYRWEGAVRTDTEWRLEIKTAADRVAALTGFLQDEHPYDTPEIITVGIHSGGAAYLDWLAAGTRP